MDSLANDPLPRAELARGVKLPTPAQVAVATVLGSPLAGGIVLAIAHRRANSGRGWVPLLVGAALTAALIVVGVLFEGAPSSIGGVVGAVAMWQLATAQLPGLGANTGAPAQRASWLAAIGIGLGTLVACVGLIVAVLVATDIDAPSITYGHDQEVQYTDGATTADARIVGSFLMERGIFRTDGKDKTVRVAREPHAVVVSFVIGDGGWTRNETVNAFTLIRGQLAELFPDSTVTVHLCDDMMDNHRTIE